MEKGQDPLDLDGDKSYYAPDVVQGPDGRFYLYYSIENSGIISVAVCDTPAGKYKFYGHVKAADGYVLGSNEEDPFQFTEFTEEDPYFTQEQETQLQYIANFRDGALADYRYFDFDGAEQSISITCRSTGDGVLEITGIEDGKKHLTHIIMMVFPAVITWRHSGDFFKNTPQVRAV